MAKDIPLENKMDPVVDNKDGSKDCPNPYCTDGHVYGVDMGDVNLGHGPCEMCEGKGYLTGTESE